MTNRNEPYADTRDMIAIHTVFRREFALMPALVCGVADGDDERARVVADHVTIVNSLVHHHHLSEDNSLWPMLLGRVSPEVASIVRVLEAQHESLEDTIVRIDAATKTWREQPTAESRQALAAVLDQVNVPLIEHIDLEEQRILPVMETCVTAAEWDGVVRAGAANAPLEGLALSLGMSMYEGDPEVMEHLLTLMPGDPADLKQRASQAFAAYGERIYGTATPPRSKR